MRRARAAVLLVLCSACDSPSPRVKSPQVRSPSAVAAISRAAPAESLYFRGEYDSAKVIWKRELDSASLTKDTLVQANALMWLGLTAWRQGDNAEARTLGERSLELKKKFSGNADLSRSYNSLGLVARDEGRLRDAAELFEQAITTARAAADTPGVSRAAANVALIQLEFGEFEKAKQGFEAARDAGHALGDERVEGNALNNLGMLTIRLGDPASAIPLINEALVHYKSIEYPTGEQNSLAQLATAYDLLGEPQRALALLDSASALAREGNMRAEEASNARLMGQVYQTMEDHRRALAHFAHAAALSHELGLAQEEATTFRSEAASHLALGRVDLARAKTRDALRIHHDEGALWEELNDLLMLSELATIAKDPADASVRLSQARMLSRKVNAPSARTEIALTEARVFARNNDWSGVLRTLDKARGDLAVTRADIAWEPASLRARAFARLGQLDSAAIAGRKAIVAAERVRGRIGSAGLRTGFTAARAATYADQVVLLLRLGRGAEAFEIADAARGRALIEHLSQARAGIAQSSQMTRDMVRGETLLRQIDELVSLLEEAQRTPKEERSLDERALEGISAKVAEAERDYSGILERLAVNDPQRTTLLGMKRTTASEVQRALRSDEALVEYLVTEDRVLAFVVNASALRQIEIPVGDSAISLRVRFARELLGRRNADGGALRNALTGMHQLLLQPVEHSGMLRGVKRLVIVPHSSLSYLPFAALINERGHYIAQDLSILTLPSAGALTALRSAAVSGARQKENVRGIVLAPFTNELPATRSEAMSIRSAIGGTTTLLDGAASESAFRDAANEGRLLHLATHGTLNVQNPLFSRIELARSGSRTTSSNDGRLSVHELIGMHTTSPLVFLSGCETALGSAWSNEFARGEDYATLSRALLYSGAANAVATLWRINDESAAVFAGHFYRHLKRMPPAEALRAAQQNMLIDRRYREPYHWAAYQVAGSGDRIALEERWWGLFAR